MGTKGLSFAVLLVLSVLPASYGQVRVTNATQQEEVYTVQVTNNPAEKTASSNVVDGINEFIGVLANIDLSTQQKGIVGFTTLTDSVIKGVTKLISIIAKAQGTELDKSTTDSITKASEVIKVFGRFMGELEDLGVVEPNAFSVDNFVNNLPTLSFENLGPVIELVSELLSDPKLFPVNNDIPANQVSVSSSVSSTSSRRPSRPRPTIVPSSNVAESGRVGSTVDSNLPPSAGFRRRTTAGRREPRVGVNGRPLRRRLPQSARSLSSRTN